MLAQRMIYDLFYINIIQLRINRVNTAVSATTVPELYKNLQGQTKREKDTTTVGLQFNGFSLPTR